MAAVTVAVAQVMNAADTLPNYDDPTFSGGCAACSPTCAPWKPW